MLIIPAVICVVTNALIYRHVRASSNRVQVHSVSMANDRGNISRRDIFLLRHMVIVFFVFVIGWTPWVSTSIAWRYTAVSDILDFSSLVSFQLALLVDIIDLFLYNHEVRKYLIQFCSSCCRG